MSPEKIELLKTNYPLVFNQPGAHPAVGDGWLGLLSALGAAIQRVNTAAPDPDDLPVQVRQIKEKFGGLRFYADGPEEIQDLINQIEHESLEVCEYCGSRVGVTSSAGDGYWIKTLCQGCRKNSE